MVEIECLACGKAVKLPRFVDNDDYDGQVVCQECKSLLHIKLVKRKVRKYKVVENKSKDFNFTELVMRMQKEQNQ
jgi:DNA-directed RNA polymerase subunit RPC12/RpoP